MRTDNPTMASSAINRLRASLSRLRRTASAQPPFLRWSLGGAALILVLVFAYLASPTPTEYISLGQRFSPADLNRVATELSAKHIAHRMVESEGKILVDSSSLADAREILTKLNLGPLSLSQIRDKAEDATSIWETTDQAETRKLRASEQEIEKLIEDLDDVAEAYVRINRPRPRFGPGTTQGATAFVRVQTLRGHRLPSQTVQSIQTIVTGHEGDIRHDAITLLDRRTKYLLAGNPEVGMLTGLRAREEELTQKILEELHHIDGLEVTVKIVPAPARPAPPVLAPAPAPSHPVAEVPAPVQVNQPMILDEPRLNPPAMVTAPLPAPVKAPAPLDSVRIWARVPASYYYKFLVGDAARNPSPAELQPFVDRTKSLIETAIAHIAPATPEREAAQVKIDTIFDGPISGPPVSASAETQPRGTNSLWVPMGTAVSVTAVFTSLVFVLMRSASRRPSARFTIPDDGGRFKVDSASEPGPSERVRELIRQSPEAAASVLRRWTGQGGRVA
jgi:type III secretory pathway lipoprotein EscJ